MTTQAEQRFRDCYEENVASMRAYLRRRLHPDDVDDALIDVFAIVWRRIQNLPDGTEARLWLYGVARNVRQNSLRGAVRRTRLRTRLEGLIDRPVPSPEVIVLRRAEDSLVHRAIGQLRATDQEILRLRAWEDLSRQEIAITLGMSPEAVDMRLNRAMKRMARALQALGYEAPLGNPHAVEEGGRA